MGSLIDYAHTKTFFIKRWSLSDKVSPIVICFFFCYKSLVNLRRQGPIDSVAAQHQGFQNYAKLIRLLRFHFPFISQFPHHLHLRSPRGAGALRIAHQQRCKGTDGKIKPSRAQTRKSRSLGAALFCYVWCTPAGFAAFSKASGAIAYDVVGADRTKHVL